MSKFLASLILACFPACLFAAEWTPLASASPAKVQVQMVSSTEQGTVLSLDLKGFYRLPMETPQGLQQKITAPGLASILAPGAPDLPKAAASIIIPDNARMEVVTESSSYLDYSDVDIAPSKGSLVRTQDPVEVSFTYGDVYQRDAFYPGTLAELQQPFIVRDYRGQAVWIYPFQYNPVTKVLRVYTVLHIRIYPAGEGGENVLVRKAPLASLDPEFAAVYRSLFRNGGNVISYLPLEENGDMLILSPASYAAALQPFMEWKAQRGLKCTWVDIAAVGNTDTDIRNYIANYHATHDLKYVLLVGDEADVATPTLSGGASDPSYGYLAGSDSYAEVMVGRFSANSVADVQTLVRRSVDYEANPTPNGAWYRKATGIASNQGPGDDGEMDWEHLRAIRGGMLSFGYTDIDELYDGSQAGADSSGDPGVSDLVNVINDGRAVINYTGHGSQTACVTTGFSTNDVPLLTNNSMLPFWWSVGCVHGEFNGGTCLAEVLTLAEYNGQPSGMVATFMSSINQQWDEPMDAQDEFDSLLTECYVNNVKRTFGGISVNGCMKMNDTYGAAGADMTNTWHIFGDPSLVIRNTLPVAVTATHPVSVTVGSTQLPVQCNINGAIVTLTKGSTILALGPVVSNMVTLTFAALAVPDTLVLTATAFNGIPYRAQVLVIPASGPYVIYSSSTVNDLAGNGDGLPDYGESILLDLELNNVGLGVAGLVNAKLTSADSYVTITDSMASFGTMVSGSSQLVPGAFAYALAGNIPDQHVITFDLVVTDASLNVWNNSFLQVVHAPDLHITSLVVDDASGNNNGFLDPGETASLLIQTANHGHSASPPAVGTLTSTSPFVTINTGAASMGSIAAGGDYTGILNVTLAPNITFGSAFDLDYNVSAAAYPVSRLFTLSAGEILEDFETNNFQKFPWMQGGNVPWLISSTAPYQGMFCAGSGNISNGQTSELRMQVTVLSADSISFYELVSSEPGYDFLRFYLDGVKLGEWSGNGTWSYHAYYVPAGVHQLRWAYEKDAFVSDGADAGWLDNIQFPPMVLPVGIAKLPEAPQLMLYPNPVRDKATLTLATDVPVKAGIYLFDMKGALQQVIAENRTLQGTESISFSTGTLAKGVYLLKMQTEDGNRVIRFVK